ncbi:MAG: 2-amino-4-hydroxy-6-hydroxymethyldihydropteridine diphosphokinase [Desulfotomaculaceae bacterium]|nr:2-amino-4-hydroxy-6-hydroxymethyldihydropteridine diphosphokinase [Desulfotomaculaceae bacterium]
MLEDKTEHTAYIGLGSNLGDKRANLGKALELLAATTGIQLKRVASYYRTAPLGGPVQDWYLNTVAEVITTLKPLPLLAALLIIEEGLGRVRTVHWGPRTVDLDLLLYDRTESHSTVLTLPHPRMTERAFVMAPLAELAPGLLLQGKTAVELAGELARVQSIEKWEN